MVILLNEQTQAHFDYLDELCESGVTNMFGASPFLAREFGLDPFTATDILGLWMKLFSARAGNANQYADLAKADGSVPELMIDRLGTEVRPSDENKTGAAQ